MPEDNQPKSKNIETYADDMAKVLEGNESGLIKKVIHEEEEYEIEKKELSPESKKNKFFMYAGLALLLVGVALLAYLLISKEEIGTVEVPPQHVPLIFTDKNVVIKVDGLHLEEIAPLVRSEVEKLEVKPKGVEGIYLVENENVITFSRFLNLIGASLILNESFNENFLIGATNQTSKDFFILFNVRSFTDVFGTIRAWEEKMFSDLHGFFGYSIDASNNYLLTKSFEDKIVRNKNARVLYDQDNNVALMYVFIEDTSIVIADTEEAVNEVILRLAGGRITK